jgi:hypothetical protein
MYQIMLGQPKYIFCFRFLCKSEVLSSFSCKSEVLSSLLWKFEVLSFSISFFDYGNYQFCVRCRNRSCREGKNNNLFVRTILTSWWGKRRQDLGGGGALQGLLSNLSSPIFRLQQLPILCVLQESELQGRKKKNLFVRAIPTSWWGWRRQDLEGALSKASSRTYRRRFFGCGSYQFCARCRNRSCREGKKKNLFVRAIPTSWWGWRRQDLGGALSEASSRTCHLQIFDCGSYQFLCISSLCAH